MHAVTSMQQVQALEIGIVASPASAVAVASSRQRMPSSTSARATSAAPSSASPSISRSGTWKRRPSSAACRASTSALGLAERGIALVEREPAVVRPRLERVEEPVRSLQPALGDRCGSVEVELVRREPGRHPRRAGHVAVLSVAAVGTLARVEHRLGVVEPPGRPAQALERLRRLVRRLEGCARGFPASGS